MLNIVLLEPEMPSNTGNIGRTCYLTNSRLHLIRPFNFRMDDKTLRRTGLDYWEHVNVTVYDDYNDFVAKTYDKNIYYATTKTDRLYSDVKFKEDDFIMFGKESKGIPESILNNNPDRCIKIPMITTMKRSLNLANSANIILFEGLRQLNYPGLG